MGKPAATISARPPEELGNGPRTCFNDAPTTVGETGRKAWGIGSAISINHFMSPLTTIEAGTLSRSRVNADQNFHATWEA